MLFEMHWSPVLIAPARVRQEFAAKHPDPFDDADPIAKRRRAARYYLYRKYVFERWGRLGKGKRVRIAPCVVEYIRNRFREPACETGCKCAVGGALFRCPLYTGHREAPDGTSNNGD